MDNFDPPAAASGAEYSPPAKAPCPECLTEIPVAAARCSACTTELAPGWAPAADQP